MKHILIAIMSSTGAIAASYYVAASGNDFNPGTISQPWQTINRVNSAKYNPGDSIMLAAGQYFAGPLFLTPDNGCGTQDNPIHITSYGSGVATINAGVGDAISIYQCGGFTVDNLTLTGASVLTSNPSRGLIFWMDLPSTILYGITIGPNISSSGFGGYGVYVGSWGVGSGYSNVLIQGVTAHDNGDGIVVTGESGSSYCHANVSITNSIAFDNPGRLGYDDTSGDGMYLRCVDGGSITYSLAYNNGASNTNPAGPVGIWAIGSRNITIAYNESHHNHTNGPYDGDGFDCDWGSVNCTLEYNYSHDNDGDGFMAVGWTEESTTGTVIRYNISQNDGRKNGTACIGLYNLGAPYTDLSGAEIFNNTCYIAGVASQSVVGVGVYTNPTTNVHVRNNIVSVAPGTGGTTDLVDVLVYNNGLLFQGNDYWAYPGASGGYSWLGGLYTSLDSWRFSSGQEMGTGLAVDPGLVSPGNGQTLGLLGNSQVTAYRLAAGSQLISAGHDLNSFGVNPGNQDYWGYGIGSGGTYSVGASQVALSPMQ